MKCATHPGVETNLRCGKCGRPICPKCLVETPVGARCVTCARPYKLPTYQVSFRNYLRAAGVALGIGLAGGIAWLVVDALSPFYLDLLLAPALGYGVSEVVSLAVNRKRGLGLAAIAASGVVVSLLVTILLGSGITTGMSGIFKLVAAGIGIWVAVNRLR